MRTNIELRQQRAGLINEAREILTADDVNQEDQNRASELIAESQRLMERIEALESVSSLSAELDRSQRSAPVTNPNDNPAAANGVSAEERSATFSRWLRRGMTGLNRREREIMAASHRDLGGADFADLETRDLGEGVGSSGGFTVPVDFYRKLTDAQKAFGGMRQSRATIIQTDNGQSLPMPTDDDTSNEGVIVDEASLITTQDVNFGQRVLGAYMYTSKMVKISRQLLQDSAFDLETWLAGRLGVRLGRITNRHFTIGTGTGQPEGVVTGGTVGVTTAGTSVITYDELVDTIHKVDPAYRANSQWMWADATLATLAKIKDTISRPLWVPGLADRTPDTVMGYPFIINQHMPAMGAGNKPIAFGDFSAYHIRDVAGPQLLRLEERFAEFLQVAFLAFERHDGLLLDAGTHPITIVQNHA